VKAEKKKNGPIKNGDQKQLTQFKFKEDDEQMSVEKTQSKERKRSLNFVKAYEEQIQQQAKKVE